MSGAIQVQGFVSVGSSAITSAWTATDIESAGPNGGVQDTEMISASAVAGGIYELQACATTQTNGDTVTVAVTYTDAVLNVSKTVSVIAAAVMAGSAVTSGRQTIRVAAASDIRVALTLSDQVDTRTSATLKRIG